MGTALIAALVLEVCGVEGDIGFVVTPDVRNTASCRVLEKNGFDLVEVRPISTEPSDDPLAIYRRSPALRG
jgi:hypothetical protein